jgi:hypothetical protein
VPEHLRFLYRHLLENDFISGIDCSDKELFKIFSRSILKQIPKGRGNWEKALPKDAVDEIVNNKFFGFRE